jgi:spore coat protein U-like protein
LTAARVAVGIPQAVGPSSRVRAAARSGAARLARVPTAIWIGPLAAALCNISVAACSVRIPLGLAFGTYDVFSSQDRLGAGSIEVTCDQPFAITLSAGTNSNDYHARRMLGPSGYLSYNLYSDTTRLAVWVDSSDPTHAVSGSGTGQAQSFDVYGRIPAGQNVSVGTYSDSVLVLVTF